MTTPAYTIQKRTRPVRGRCMVFGRWTDESNEVVIGWDVLVDGRVLRRFPLKRDARAWIKRQGLTSELKEKA